MSVTQTLQIELEGIPVPQAAIAGSPQLIDAGRRTFDAAPSNILNRSSRFIITTLVIATNLVQVRFCRGNEAAEDVID